jgi:hypothetical protein
MKLINLKMSLKIRLKIFLFIFFTTSSQLSYSQWLQRGADILGFQSGGTFGNAVAISKDGNTVLVGSREVNGLGDKRGRAAVYKYSNNSWNKIGGDINGIEDYENLGYSVSINYNGNIIATSAPYSDGGSTYKGQTRVFSLVNNVWTQLGGNINGEQDGHQSGHSISLNDSGNIIAIGAPLAKINGQSTIGCVHVYSLINGSWKMLGNRLMGEDSLAQFGGSVDLSADGKTLGVGANYMMAGFADTARAYVFSLENNNWVQKGKTIFPQENISHFGNSVSLSSDGNTIAVGAPEGIFNMAVRGVVRVFRYSFGSWNQIGKLLSGDANADKFGYSVSLSNNGNILAVGAYRNEGNQDEKGVTKIFEYKDSEWIQKWGKIKGVIDDEGSGWSVSINGNGKAVAIGAPWGTNQNGKVRVFSTCVPDIDVKQKKDSLEAVLIPNATYQWLNCDDFMKPVLNANKRIFKAQNNTSYAMEISLNGCKDTSNCFFFTYSPSRLNNSEYSKLEVYPNPTSNNSTIYFNRMLYKPTIKLYNIYGQLVYNKVNISDNCLNLNHLNLSKGIYFINLVEDEQNLEQLKLVIE